MGNGYRLLRQADSHSTEGSRIKSIIVSITKCSIVIGSPRDYLIPNWMVITWGSNFSCPIWTFCNWIAAIGQLRCVRVNQVHWNGFFIAVSPPLAKLIIKDTSPGEGYVYFLISHFLVDTINSMVTGLRVVQFRGNRACNFTEITSTIESSSRYALGWFKITRPITPWIVLHSVQLKFTITNR